MRHAFSMLLSALLLCSCQQQVHTWSLNQALEYINFQQTVSRGVDYLGSDAGFHYFEHKKALGNDVRFRISTSENYAPGSPMPYRAWFPDRTPAYGELDALCLNIHYDSRNGTFVYWYKGKKLENPAAIPTEILQSVRLIFLPDKRADINEQALQPIRQHLENKIDADFSAPTSGLPAFLLEHRGERSSSGTISTDALDELIRKRS